MGARSGERGPGSIRGNQVASEGVRQRWRSHGKSLGQQHKKGAEQTAQAKSGIDPFCTAPSCLTTACLSCLAPLPLSSLPPSCTLPTVTPLPLPLCPLCYSTPLKCCPHHSNRLSSFSAPVPLLLVSLPPHTLLIVPSLPLPVCPDSLPRLHSVRSVHHCVPHLLRCTNIWHLQHLRVYWHLLTGGLVVGYELQGTEH